jgi:hypothetical protein
VGAALVAAALFAVTSRISDACALDGVAALRISSERAVAQASSTAAKPCGSQEYRQLDFWVGEWRVFEASDNSSVGSSKIEIVMEQCGIKESFDVPPTGAADCIGTSYSSYDRKDGK